MLQGFQSGLDNKGIKWIKREETEPPFLSQLKDLMLKIKANGPRPRSSRASKPVKEEDQETDLAPDLNLVLERQDMDLTDLLWDVLKKSESFEELRQAWEFVFASISREDSRPYVINDYLSGILFSRISCIPKLLMFNASFLKLPKL